MSLRPLKNVQFCSSSRKAKILTAGIHGVFRGLKFKSDAEIEQKGAFCKGLTFSLKEPLARYYTWIVSDSTQKYPGR